VLVFLDEGDSADRASILESGADECLTAPVVPRELVARLARLMSGASLGREATRHGAELARELARARRIQQYIMPLKPPTIEGLEIVAEYLPAVDVGGDFFDILTFDRGRAGLFMADVAGHGIGAAMNAMLIKSQLAVWAKASITVGETLGMLNHYLFSLTEIEYATAVYALVDVPARQMEYSLAGHPPPVLVRRGQQARLLEAPAVPQDGQQHVGLPLAMFDSGAYVSARLSLDPGDRVVLYTDGLTEWRDSEGAMLGLDGLCGLLDQSRGRPLRQQVAWLLGELQARSPDGNPLDDVNLLAFEVA
jgi:sigma-B regulation protein RsbU (phosphoserine phosphatase)